MFKPEEQQIEICLLKGNLEEIENDLVTQRRALPSLDAENEQKSRETMNALKVTRSLNFEIERLKLENVRLTAKRMQLKQQSDDQTKSLERIRETQTELTNLLDQEKREIELNIRQYEDSLADIAERFRKTHGFYNENEINAETENVNTIIMELETELKQRQNTVEDLKRQLDMAVPDVPEDFLNTLGKVDLEIKMKELTDKYESLLQKRNLIYNKKKEVSSLMYYKDFINNNPKK